MLVLGVVLGAATIAVGTRLRAGLVCLGGTATAVAVSFVPSGTGEAETGPAR